MDHSEAIQKKADLLLSQLITDYTVSVSKTEEVYTVQINTETEAPTLIGRHGDTIRALQRMLEIMMFKQTSESCMVSVNVNDYREKQEERLTYIANEAAQRVIATHERSYLRGFTSYERRIMHDYIGKNYPHLMSSSTGEGRDRRLVVEEKRDEQE
jgi:predicted RNA-binding protein Jag